MKLQMNRKSIISLYLLEFNSELFGVDFMQGQFLFLLFQYDIQLLTPMNGSC